jgi:hypothetical protein
MKLYTDSVLALARSGHAPILYGLGMDLGNGNGMYLTVALRFLVWHSGEGLFG